MCRGPAVVVGRGLLVAELEGTKCGACGVEPASAVTRKLCVSLFLLMKPTSKLGERGVREGEAGVASDDRVGVWLGARL